MGGMTKVATIIRLTAIHALLLLAAVILVPRLMAATPLKKVRLAYSAFAYANPPFWIAQELKLFEKYGLDTELVYVSGARPIQAMLGGSIDVSQVGGAATVAADGRIHMPFTIPEDLGGLHSAQLAREGANDDLLNPSWRAPQPHADRTWPPPGA